MYRALPLFLGLVGASLVLPRGAGATIVEHLALPQLVAKSDRIVRGTVVAQQSHWDEAHDRIYTDVTVRVADTYKGPAAPTVTVRRQGGTVSGIGMRTIGEAAFSDGEEVVLFLRRIALPSGGEIHQAVGLSQGKLHIARNASSGPRVLFDPRGASLIDRKADGRIQVSPGQPTERALPDLENEVRALVGAAK